MHWQPPVLAIYKGLNPRRPGTTTLAEAAPVNRFRSWKDAPSMTTKPPDLASLDLGGVEITEILHDSEKYLLARGRHRDGRRVMIKFLRSGDELWRAKFAHEIRLYHAFSDSPPPVRVPALIHTDEAAVLAIEHMRGTVIDADRYPQHLLQESELTAVLDSVTKFARWAPPPATLTPEFDYLDRIDRYHRKGFFDDTDHAALQALLQHLPPPAAPAHGDPLPSNFLCLEDGHIALLDFEFTGLFLPGFDLALLHTLVTMQTDTMYRVLRVLGIDVDAEDLLHDPSPTAARMYAQALTLANAVESLREQTVPTTEARQRFAEAQKDADLAAMAYKQDKGITSTEAAAVYRRVAAEVLPPQ